MLVLFCYLIIPAAFADESSDCDDIFTNEESTAGFYIGETRYAKNFVMYFKKACEWTIDEVEAFNEFQESLGKSTDKASESAGNWIVEGGVEKAKEINQTLSHIQNIGAVSKKGENGQLIDIDINVDNMKPANTPVWNKNFRNILQKMGIVTSNDQGFDAANALGLPGRAAQIAADSSVKGVSVKSKYLFRPQVTRSKRSSEILASTRPSWHRQPTYNEMFKESS